MIWDSGTIKERISKITDSFSGEKFQIPRNAMEVDSKLQDINRAISDAREVLKKSKQTLR